MTNQWNKKVVQRNDDISKKFEQAIMVACIVLVCLKAIKNIWSSL